MPHIYQTENVIAGTGHKIFLFISIIIADIFPSKCNCFNFPDIRSNCSSPLSSLSCLCSALTAEHPPTMPASLQRYPLSASSSQTKYDPPFSFPFRICSRSVAHIKHPRKTTQRYSALKEKCLQNHLADENFRFSSAWTGQKRRRLYRLTGVFRVCGVDGGHKKPVQTHYFTR